MKSNNDEKSILNEYLNENKGEAKSTISLNSDSISLAPSGKRIVAAIIDKIIIMIIANYVFGPVVKLAQLPSLTLFFVNIALDFVYGGYFYSTKMATPGKLIFNLQVADDKNEKLSFLTGGLRDSLGKSISGLILGIGYLMGLIRSDKKSLHDLMFKTRVINKL